MYARQECEDHAMWYRHLSVAFWFILGMTIIFIATDNAKAVALSTIIDTIILTIRTIIDVRHKIWHAKQDK